MGKYVLAIDCGTQSVRGIIFDTDGTLLAKEKRIFDPYDSLHPGWVEQNPEHFWKKVCEVTNALKTNYAKEIEQVDTIVVTTQRDTCVLMDKEGNVLRPAISWMDQRTIEHARPISPLNRLGTTIVGMGPVIKTMSRHCNAHWIQDHEPEIWEKTYKYLQVSGYLAFKLTGELKDSIAGQIGHIPFNYKKYCWEKKGRLKCQLFQIERDKLCDLVEAGGKLGSLSKQAAMETGLVEGIYICATGSDKGCETLGVGCLDNTTASISLGSNATIETTTSKYYETERFIPPFPAVIPQRYNPEITIYSGYWLINWFKKEFANKEVKEAESMGISPEELLSQKLSNIKPGSEGLLLQPYWKAGLKRPEAKGTIIGFSDYHTRIHIYRAIIEGIGFALYEGMKKIEKKSGYQIKRIMISGGGSQSDEICQITADIFNRPVSRVQTPETSALGAAITGYVQKGIFKNYEEAVHSMVHNKDTFEPNKTNATLYSKLYERVYKRLYKRVQPFYKTMNEIILQTEGE